MQTLEPFKEQEDTLKSYTDVIRHQIKEIGSLTFLDLAYELFSQEKPIIEMLDVRSTEITQKLSPDDLDKDLFHTPNASIREMPPTPPPPSLRSSSPPQATSAQLSSAQLSSPKRSPPPQATSAQLKSFHVLLVFLISVSFSLFFYLIYIYFLSPSCCDFKRKYSFINFS
jgi:hypothetical protein